MTTGMENFQLAPLARVEVHCDALCGGRFHIRSVFSPIVSHFLIFFSYSLVPPLKQQRCRCSRPPSPAPTSSTCRCSSRTTPSTSSRRKTRSCSPPTWPTKRSSTSTTSRYAGAEGGGEEEQELLHQNEKKGEYTLDPTYPNTSGSLHTFSHFGILSHFSSARAPSLSLSLSPSGSPCLSYF